MPRNGFGEEEEGKGRGQRESRTREDIKGTRNDVGDMRKNLKELLNASAK